MLRARTTQAGGEEGGLNLETVLHCVGTLKEKDVLKAWEHLIPR